MTKTTVSEPAETRDEQTHAQWAVRWFALVSVGLLCVSVPLVHVVWHGLLGHAEPPLRTRSQTELAAPEVSSLLSGDWMERAERSLQEGSPVVWWLRGHWNELRYRLGVPDSQRVRFGRRGWMYLRSTCEVAPSALRASASARRDLFVQVRDRLRQAGVGLVVAIVPDKVRVYPQYAFADGELPDGHRQQYAALLAELAALDVPAVDLEQPLRAAAAAAAAAEPGNPAAIPLYYARDTHWRPGGALVASQVIAAAVEARFGDRLSARVAMTLTGPSTFHAVGDLTMMSGMLAVVRERPDGGERTVALSLLTDELGEAREYYGLERQAGRVALTGDDRDAEILLVGTSFAEENGLDALAFALGRPVYGRLQNGASALPPMRTALREIERGEVLPKVVVWQIVERGLRDAPWRSGEL